MLKDCYKFKKAKVRVIDQIVHNYHLSKLLIHTARSLRVHIGNGKPLGISLNSSLCLNIYNGPKNVGLEDK